MPNALPSFMKWLPVSTTATINRCEFMCRAPMDGFITGRHRSAKKGASGPIEVKVESKGLEPATVRLPTR